MKLGQVGAPYVLISVLSMSVIATKSKSISSKEKRKVLNLHRIFAIFIILLNDLSGMSQSPCNSQGTLRLIQEKAMFIPGLKSLICT